MDTLALSDQEFTKQYLALEPFLHSLSRRLCRDRDLAEDMVQETFVKAWRKLQTYRGSARFSTWLFGIAYNEFRTVARQRKELALEDVEEPVAEATESTAGSRSDLRNLRHHRAATKADHAKA